VDQKQIVISLLAKAYKYRDFARWVGDRETVQRILALADELILTSEGAPARSGKKTGDRPEGMKNSGSKQSGKSGKLKRSQMRAATINDADVCYWRRTTRVLSNLERTL
jgi:hypothetical protein